MSFNSHRGTLYIRVGPMFSGKTTWLNGELTQLADKNFTVLKIVHSSDIRDDVSSSDFKGTTHNSSYKFLTEKITVVRADSLSNLDVSKFNVIGVDESQFFSDLYLNVQHWVEHLGIHVRVSGLDGDSSKNKFGQTLDLIPICDEIIKLNASCYYCLYDLKKLDFKGNILSIVGPFTKRIDSTTEQTSVGGSDKYISVCRFHHL
jgi:thymidine kinase